MIGLATRAGKVRTGTFLALRELRSGRGCLVILAKDASDGSSKKILNACTSHHVPVITAGTMEEIGHAAGDQERTCVCITDERFAQTLMNLFDAL